MASSNAARSRRAHLRSVPGGKADGEAEISDAQLIAAVRGGDDRVARELYDRLSDTVDRTLYRVFGRRETDHDDLMQSAFEQIVLTLSRQSFAGACSLKTWASSVSAHVGLTALRTRTRERKWLDRHTEVDSETTDGRAAIDVERLADARHQLASVRRHLVKMKPEQAEAVFLHDALGHELTEIALMTHISVRGAQSRLVRGRRDLLSRVERHAKQEKGRRERD